MQHPALFLVAVVLAVSPLASTAAVYECAGGVYTANSTYEVNLRRLAAILPAETASSQSLQVFRGVGYWPNRVRAFSRCYRHSDVTSWSCAACVADAFREAERACPYGKVMVLARNCTLGFAAFPRSVALGYTDGYSLDPYVVLPTTNGQASRSGFWVQPAPFGYTGAIYPVQLAF